MCDQDHWPKRAAPERADGRSEAAAAHGRKPVPEAQIGLPLQTERIPLTPDVPQTIVRNHKSSQLQKEKDGLANLLFPAINLNGRKSVEEFASRSGVAVDRLKHYDETSVLPPEPDLGRICAAADMTRDELALAIGRVDRHLLDRLREHAREIAEILGPAPNRTEEQNQHKLAHETEFGHLYQGDCLSLMPTLEEETVDLVFADPPFNLNKLYPSGIDDDLKERQYLQWCETWLDQSIRLLRPGGSLFVWNLPKWNIHLAHFLAQRLTFRHWIAVDIKFSLPISNRLYPSHYSLVYFVKGPRPTTFCPDRLPMQVCPKCAGDLRDYGGYKHKMNPTGVNLTDVWYDIPPVRHSKYKNREGANELAIQLMDRVIEMASSEGDTVLDPFGGAGTTYAVAEIKRRRWIGCEIGPVEDIVRRLENLEEERIRLATLREDLNCLFTHDTLAKREQLGLWTHETVRQPK